MLLSKPLPRIMLCPHASSATFMATIFAFFLFLFFLLWILKRSQKAAQKKTLPPEAGGAWPVIGHLHQLGGAKPAHITLGNMADKYGSIFTIRLGVHRAVVVSSWEIAKECFTTNDKAFASRPKAIATELMGYNYAMVGFTPYGPYWRHVRKIATLEVLSNHRLEMLKHIRESEVNTSVKEMYELCVKNRDMFVEMKRWFGFTTLNVVFRMVVGKRFDHGAAAEDEDEGNRRCREALRDFFELMGTFVAADALPYLRWLDLGGYEKAMKRTAKDLDHALEGWLKEHKQRKVSGDQANKGHQDFMDVMLTTVTDDDQEIPNYDADTVTKATCLALILGGMDTTTVTLTWALSLLLNNPEVLKKAQEELDIQIGRERQVKESDMKNLVYLQAILKETMRLYPAGPLSVPHESMEDCTLAGYHVPAGTRLLVNISKIHRDPQVWSDPNEFRPERFFTTHMGVDVRGKHFEFIPFGTGRRMCPGISFALQVMQLTLATLLQGFEIANPSDEAVDMTEQVGLTNLKATPLQVRLTPRLPAQPRAGQPISSYFIFIGGAIFVKQSISIINPPFYSCELGTTPELLPGITQSRFRSFFVFGNMQALRGSIRLVRRQSISSLSSVDSKSNISRSAAAKFHGSSIGSLSRFLYRPAVSYTRIGSQAEMSTASNNGIPLVSVACRSSRPDLFQWAAVMSPFIRRSFSTAENLVESASQDSSACASDVAPRIKFKRLDKTAKHIMQILDKEAVEEVRAERTMPDIKPGYIVQLKVEVPENKRRVSILKGIVIARRNAGLNSTFRLRRLVAGVGVESLFPVYSPNIKEIKVLDKKKVRRAKLYYLRDKMNALKKQ